MTSSTATSTRQWCLCWSASLSMWYICTTTWSKRVRTRSKLSPSPISCPPCSRLSPRRAATCSFSKATKSRLSTGGLLRTSKKSRWSTGREREILRISYLTMFTVHLSTSSYRFRARCLAALLGNSNKSCFLSQAGTSRIKSPTLMMQASSAGSQSMARLSSSEGTKMAKENSLFLYLKKMTNTFWMATS